MKRTTTLLLATLLFASAPVMGQEVDETVLAAARQVGSEGLEAYKQGQYEVALEKLNRAYAVVKAPTLGLWTARAMAQLGQLVEASERYLEVTRLEVTGGDVELQEEAKRVAAEEREELLPRIPQLTLNVQGAPAGQVQVQLDGEDVPPALLGLKRPMNPGVRQAIGRSGEQVVTEEVTLAEGETKSVTLDFTPPAAATPQPPVVAAPPTATTPSPAGPGPAAQQPPAAPDTGPSPGRGQRILGWVSIGIGGAGLVVGGGTAAILASKKKYLEASADCANEACGPEEHDAVDEYNALRPVSTAGFVVGGVGLAAGLTLLLTAPTEMQTSAGGVSPWVGAGSAGLVGRF